MSGFIGKKAGRFYPVVEDGKDPETGKRRRKWYPGYEKEEEADAALREIQVDTGRGVHIKPDKRTFGAYVRDEWLPSIDVRESTLSSYRRNLELHVIPTLGALRLQEIDSPRLNRLYRELSVSGRRDDKDGGLSPRTVRYISTIVSKAMRDAVAWRFILVSPADAARPPSAKSAAEAAPEMVTWTGPQLGAFLTATKDDRYGPAFAFLATTGMRRGEALGLRWEDIDLETGRVAIRRARIAVDHQAVAGKTKTGRSRVIELDARTVAVLRSWKARQSQERLLVGAGYQDEGLVFTFPDGRGYHPERFSREFERKQATYNRLHADGPLPRLRLHDLRHTWATLALQSSVHPKVVAERLGHTTTNVTLNIYSHVTQAMASNAAENVAAQIGGAW